MKSPRSRRLPALLARWGLRASLGLLTAGCANPPRPAIQAPDLRSTRIVPGPESVAGMPVQSVSHTEQSVPSSPAENKTRSLPLTLDTVLRLAEEQNSHVALAREKLRENQAEKALADLGWLPRVSAGVVYYRHEGGIQNEDGTLQKSSTGALFPGLDLTARVDLSETLFRQVDAERKLWQQRGEISRITSEKLLEAATLYIDLLAARTAEADMLRLHKLEEDLLKWAETRYKDDKTAEVLLEGIRTSLSGRRQIAAQFRQQGDAAAVQLAYVLGLGPTAVPTPADARLAPVDLIDPATAEEELLGRALVLGPGVREMENLLGVIQGALDQASGRGRFVPIVELRVLEGGFGAGPGANLNWENRLDVGLQARWNLTDLLTAGPRTDAARSRIQQAQLTYDDLRARLTTGVREAKLAVNAGKEQVPATLQQLRHAQKTYDLSNRRLLDRIEGATTAEVLAAIRALELAHLNSLNVIRSYNKAQVRLLVLTGAIAGNAGRDCP